MKNNEQVFKDEYNKLNKAQKEAVDAIDGPVMVIAGPGTGKTQILALRIANILKKTDAKSEDILALTFTNAGVISMRERLQKIIGELAYRINIFTFHSFCENIIKEFPFYFDRLVGSKVINELERVEILENILANNKFKELSTFHDDFYFLRNIANAISNIKKEGLSPLEFEMLIPKWKQDLLSNEDLYYKRNYGEYKKGDIKPTEKEKIDRKIAKVVELVDIFNLYQEEIIKLGRYDFSDMILSVLGELERNKDLKADLQERYQYILVDEHQDTNTGQNKLIELLTDAQHLEGRANIFAVGDEKQSIYRFQGASAETFRHFEKLYKDIKYINLIENYRSTQSILDGATSVIKNNPELLKSENLHSNSGIDEKIRIYEFSNYKFELLYLAKNISEKIKTGISPKEIAVIYRAHKYVSDIKSVFDHQGIPYTIFAKENILDDSNIKSLIRFLRVIENPNDDESFGHLLFVKFLNLDIYDSVRILEKFKRTKKSTKKHILAILEEEKTLKESDIQNVSDFSNLAKLIKELKIDSKNSLFPNFFKTFLEKSGYLDEMLQASDGQNQLLKIDKLFDEIKKQTESKADYGLSDFIYFVNSLEKYDLDIQSTSPEIIEGVNLITAHGSKGREFEYVYVLNGTRASWENSGGRTGIDLPIPEYEGDIEDERRLFYVAMTRAKKELSILYSNSDNEGRIHEPSQFINEIDENSKDKKIMAEFEKDNLSDLFDFISPVRQENSLFEPDYIRSLFFRRTMNVSALNNYTDCPMKYFYRNLLQIPSTYESPMVFGNIIHESLEKFFLDCKIKEKISSKEILLSLFEKILSQKILDEKEEEKFLLSGREYLSDYYDEYAKTWTTNVELEKYIKRDFALDNGEFITISGKIDKIEYLDNSFGGKINIVDYKTGGSYSEKSKEQKNSLERQLIFYDLLFEDYDQGQFEVNKSTLDFIQKNKKGKFEQHTFPVTKENIEDLKKEINKCAEEVLSLEFLKKGCGKKDCEWCNLAKK